MPEKNAVAALLRQEAGHRETYDPARMEPQVLAAWDRAQRGCEHGALEIERLAAADERARKLVVLFEKLRQVMRQCVAVGDFRPLHAALTLLELDPEAKLPRSPPWTPEERLAILRRPRIVTNHPSQGQVMVDLETHEEMVQWLQALVMVQM